MPVLSKRSLSNLSTCDLRLQRIASYAIMEIDFVVTEGHRDQELQERYFNEGKTKLHWPDGNHNKMPSIAFDAIPYPVPADWGETTLSEETVNRFHLLAGVIKGVAVSLGYKVRWGGDWNMNNISSDERFRDFPHFELFRVAG